MPGCVKGASEFRAGHGNRDAPSREGSATERFFTGASDEWMLGPHQSRNRRRAAQSCLLSVSAYRVPLSRVPVSSVDNHRCQSLVGPRLTHTVVRHDQIEPNQMETKIVGCPAGFEAVGGGIDFGVQTTFAQGVRVVANGPRVGGDRSIAANDGQNSPATGGSCRSTMRERIRSRMP